MASAFSHLDRPPLSQARLSRALIGDFWTDIRVVNDTASTNADVAQAARAGAPQGLVIIAEHQSGGRGRLDRTWVSPPRSGLAVSMLLRPDGISNQLAVVPLLAGVAAVNAVVGVGGLEARLKWPNDVIVGHRKLAGILAERIDDAVVVGIGLNVSTTQTELPFEGATSIAIEDGNTDREILAKELLRSMARHYVAFRDTQWSTVGVLAAYRDRCATIGTTVSVQRPGGDVLTGVAETVDDAGRLVVRDSTGEVTALSVGDVTHVRAAI